jgi:DNA-binding PadR family transcriptional regulator
MAEKVALGEFEHHVLLATLRLGERAYTTSILKELEERTGREVSASAVYVALRRLEEHGLMASGLRSGEELGERRERRYFRVTPQREDLVVEARRRLERMWEGLEVQHARG